MDNKTKEFINKYLNEDIHTLSLRYKTDRTIDKCAITYVPSIMPVRC